MSHWSSFLDEERYGPKTYYHLHVKRDGEWSIATTPQHNQTRFRTLPSVRAIRDCALMDEDVQAAMVVKVDEVSHSDLETRRCFTIKQFTGIID